MPPLTVCPECRTRLRFGADTRGQMIRCPECDVSLKVSSEGCVERASDDSPGAAHGSLITRWRVTIAAALILVAFGVGWSIGTTRQPESHGDDTSSTPVPAQPEKAREHPPQRAAALPQVKQEQSQSDVRLASATERPRQSQIEPPNAERPDATPKAVVAVPASPQQAEPGPRQGRPDADVQPLAPQKVVPPPPVPREEELPAPSPVAKPMVPIETLARLKLQRFEVSKPTPLKEVLRDLSELVAGRLELAETVSSQELDQRITLALTDTEVVSVIEATLKSTSLRVAIQGDRIVISPK